MSKPPRDQNPYKLSWSTSGLTPLGQIQQSYEIVHATGIFSSGPEFTLISRTGANPGAIVGTFDWHSLSQKVKMKFPSRNVEISYRALNGHFDAHGDIGRVEWKATGMDGYKASWRLSEADGKLLSIVELHSSGKTGTIEIQRTDLPWEAFEEVLVSSLAQIEDHRRLLRNARKSAIGALASAAGLGAVIGT
ncbi:hypothetical protein BKA67DRAFT_585880 [Truncatella angustata]|uniref:Uncharacterized protein n=1 Tax=Truncatella angustata TaxID=152316 RepID=A0A9P8RGX6_9PEZI|nr:uncharacterized protein BKA67DRAFT_585880 [Truncatella angustata]KAH6645627.1 hypothetical protein BKA67DRAFT_585880 [Truncatella angustata]